MSDTSAELGAPVEEQAPEAPDSGASVVPVEETGGAEAAQVWPWSSEHPEWGPEDVHKAWDAARKEIRSRGSEPTQEEAPHDPYADLPPGDDPALIEDLGAIFQGQKAFQDGSYGPQAVLGWLARSPGVLSQQTRGQFLLAWQQQDPWSAQSFIAQHTLQAERDRLREELRQEYGPAVESTRASMNSTAISIAAQDIPEWDAALPRITDYIENENPYAMAGVDGPEQIADRLAFIAGGLYYRDQITKRRAERTQQVTAPPPPAGAATQTRSRAENGQFTAREQHRKDVADSLRRTKV